MATPSGPSSRPRSTQLRPAGLLRRLPALLLDLVAPTLLIGLLVAADVLERSLIAPPPGWFWSEWWLSFWLDDPTTLWTPVLVFVLLGLLWNTGWELALGRTPGAMALGLRVVDRGALPIGRAHALRRGLGAALNVLTLGLGYGLVAVTPLRRGLHDLVGGSVVVRGP